MRNLFILWVVATLSACSSFTKPDKETRITEYHGHAEPGLAGDVYVKGDLEIDGCRFIEMRESTDGCLTYQGDKCSYRSPGCSDPLTGQ